MAKPCSLLDARVIYCGDNLDQLKKLPDNCDDFIYIDPPLRAKRRKGFFVSFDYSSDALAEIDAFFRRERVAIVPLSVRDILDEQIARKLL